MWTSLCNITPFLRGCSFPRLSEPDISLRLSSTANRLLSKIAVHMRFPWRMPQIHICTHHDCNAHQTLRFTYYYVNSNLIFNYIIHSQSVMQQLAWSTHAYLSLTKGKLGVVEALNKIPWTEVLSVVIDVFSLFGGWVRDQRERSCCGWSQVSVDDEGHGRSSGNHQTPGKTVRFQPSSNCALICCCTYRYIGTLSVWRPEWILYLPSAKNRKKNPVTTKTTRITVLYSTVTNFYVNRMQWIGMCPIHSQY